MVSELILNPFETVLNSFISILPGLSAFIVIVTAGLFASWIIGNLVAGILRKTGLDRWYRKIELDKTVGDLVPSAIVGVIIKLWVFITFFIAATDVLDLGSISILLSKLALWLPNLIVASLIVLFGWIAANISYTKIKNPRVEASAVLAVVTKVIIFVFTALIALSQIGIKISFAENSILVVLAGLMLGIALAIGRGLGLIFEKKGDKILKYFGINI